MIPGHKRTLYLGTQDDRDTPQATPTKAFRVSDFSPNPVRTLITLGETDETSQQRSNVVVGNAPGFSFKCYLRPGQAALLFQSLLGTNVDSGTTPHYVHTMSPDEDTPYLTVFEAEPGVWCNQYDGVRVTQIQLDMQVGGACEATVTCEGIGFTAGVDEPVGPAADSDLPYVWGELTVKRAGAHPGTANQVTVTISRNGFAVQGDTGPNRLDYINGLFSIAGQITKYADTDADQRQVDTGSTTGTTPTTTIYEETLEIKLARDANVSVDISIAAASYPSRAAAVNVDGSPLVEVMGFRSDPQSTLAGHATVVVKDTLATPDS